MNFVNLAVVIEFIRMSLFCGKRGHAHVLKDLS